MVHNLRIKVGISKQTTQQNYELEDHRKQIMKEVKLRFKSNLMKVPPRVLKTHKNP